MNRALPRSRSMRERSARVGMHAGGAVLWLVIILAAAAAILSYKAFESRVDRRLRDAVLERLGQMFPHTRIVIQRVTIEGPSKIAVHGLRMGIKDGNKARQVLEVGRLDLTGDLDIAHFVQETVQVHQVDIFRPQIDLWQTQSGVWSVLALAYRKTDNTPTPKVCIHDGELRVFRELRSDASPIIFHDIKGQVGEAGFVAGDEPLGALGARLLEGKLVARSSGTCEAVEVSGSLDRARGQWSIEGSMRDLDFSTDLISKLPVELSQSLTQLAGLSCKASANFLIERPAAQSPWAFKVRGKLASGRLQDSRLPYPLEELSGDFFCENESLQLRNIKARSGEASFKLETDIKGFHPQAPVVIHAESTMLQLDGRVYSALPAKWRAYWDRIRPEGYVDAKVYLASDGTTWRPRLEIACRDVQLECWLFPYPLTNVVGSVCIESDRISGQELSGKAGGQPITGGFDFSRVASEWFGRLQMNSAGAIAIDEKVLSALTVRSQPTSNVERFVRSLEPAGSFQVQNAAFERRQDQPDVWHKELDIRVYDCSMLYQNFRYPLHRIKGRILATDDHWRLEGFEGWNDGGRIECNGEWVDGREAGVPFRLGFTAYALAMEEELRRALPADARQLWEQIEPSGSLDRAEVSIVRRTGDAPVDIQVALHEENEPNSDTGHSLRLHPKSFPYWLSDVACDLTYRPGFLDIAQASATNGNSRVLLGAQCRQNAAGNWVGSVRWLPSSRVMVDTQLLQALPEAINHGLIELDLRGPVNVIGETKFELPVDGSRALATDLNLQLDMEDVQLGDGKVVDGVRGTLWLIGRRDDVHLQAVGWASIDAVSIRGVPVTQVRGPLALVGNQLFFGSEVQGHYDPAIGNQLFFSPEVQRQPDPATGMTVADVTAEALSGNVSLSGSGQLDSGKFQIKSKLVDADLRCLLQDLGASQAPTDARCQAELTLAGVPWQPQTYSGNGMIHLSDAQLYQLPTMIQLLRKLSVTPTDKAAFHSAEIAFTIDGDRIPLTLRCDGDLLSLRGSGWTNFRRELDLELYSYVGGRVPVSSVLTPLVAESRYATFMSLEVDGTIDNPRIERRAFPQLAVLQQMFPDKVPAEEEPNRLFGRWREREEVPQTTDPRSGSLVPVPQ